MRSRIWGMSCPISIHAPAKGATSKRFCIHRCFSISIHAPAKGATEPVIGDVKLVVISIHAPAKGATSCRWCTCKLAIISIHAPAKGATIHRTQTRCIHRFQSTLPRRERQPVPSLSPPDYPFQSTLPRRERLCVCGQRQQDKDFNPRSREGSDIKDADCFHDNDISIHAPAKGATDYCGAEEDFLLFQSTLPRRERHNSHNSHPPTQQFQSTLPRRERRRFAEIEGVAVYFNPRSREGSDIFYHDNKLFQLISIHAPAKGATLSRRTM